MSVQVSAPEYARRGLVRTGAAVEGAASVLISAWEGLLATVTVRHEHGRERRSYPRHCGYLEDAAMCREMRRL